MCRSSDWVVRRRIEPVHFRRAASSRVQWFGIGAALLLAGAGCKEHAPDDLVDAGDTSEAIVFVKTNASETLNRNGEEANLYKLSPISPEGKLTPLTAFVGASISDPCVSFDGKFILFSMRPSGGRERGIYEIGADGRGLRQVTRGGDDFDPLYLPDGRILFTSSRAGEMDEYNHAPAEHLHIANADGSALHRISFNQSDDFDPVLLASGRVLFTRWEHFGNMNRFPLFAVNPDGTGAFHSFGPHGQNFFHPQPTPDGRIIAIASTEVNGDAGPIAFLKPEQGPADPASASDALHWDLLTPDINQDGAPWEQGTFKYPFPLGENRYAVSYALPAATEEEADYALYTLSVAQQGSGDATDPATISLHDLTFLYNDPETNELDAQLLAPHAKPPILPDVVIPSEQTGVFIAQDVFNRGTNDGQERPERGVDAIDRIAVFASRPTMRGEPNDFSANEFEKRSFLGYAPVESDGSFAIRVPADTPISFGTLDEHGRGFVVKRTWLYLRPGEVFDKCTGCHEDRVGQEPVPTNPHPLAAERPPTDLNVPVSARRILNYRETLAPVVEAKCAGCHLETYAERDTLLPDGTTATVIDTIPPPGDLDLTAIPDTTEMNRVFPRGYLSLSGETMEGKRESVVDPGFPRRSTLIDWLLGLGSRAGSPQHPEGEQALTAEEKESFNLWVLLGAQYR